jgi:hypothetical protein
LSIWVVVYRELYELGELDRTLSVVVRRLVPDEEEDDEDDLDRGFKVHRPVLRIRDVYPGSCFLPIPDPGSQNSNKREG